MTEELTQERDLRTGTPLWADSPHTTVRTRRPKDVEYADVAVIGAGISGALMSHALTSRGYSVVLLDRRPPGHGSTAASTALLQYELDLPLSKLADEIGWGRAMRTWQRSFLAVERLKALVQRERIACGWRDKRSLYLAGNDYGSRALRTEHRARLRAGLPSEYLVASRLRKEFDLDRTGAIQSTGVASANPAQLTAGILRRCQARGARVLFPADVQELSADQHGVVLETADGACILGRAAVFCTGYELPEMVRTTPGDTIKSTWALATDPIPNLPAWLQETLLWEASDPYLYLRSTPDARLVAGGEDEPSSDLHANPRVLQRKTDTVAQKIQKLFPTLAFQLRYRWAGAFGESPTGRPIIGPIAGFPNCYSVTGFGGNGITFSMLASEIIASDIADTPDPDADLFRAGR